MKHLRKHWLIYTYILLQIFLIIIRYKEIVNWKWTYIMMPTWIMLTLLLLLLILAFMVDIEDRRSR